MVGIIHMNGRLYDPFLRRFLNADEHIQDMFNTQNYNKYGYVLNNPLMYNDPSGEFFFGLLAIPLIKAIFIGAAIGLAAYTVGLAVSGNIGMWNLGGALKATLFGAVSGAITFGIGSIFKAAASTFGNALLQAGAHGLSQGVLGLVQGQNFLSSAASGVFGSLGAYGWGKAMNGIGLGQFSQSTYGMIGFGALSGGVGAELTGGNFWQGVLIGGIVSGLNHAMHSIDWQRPEQQDQYSSQSSKKLSQNEFNEYVKQNRDLLDKYAEYLKQTAGIIGTVPTDAVGLRDFFKDLFKFKLSAFKKIINIKTLVGTHIYATGKEFENYSKMLGDVKYNYDKMNGNSAGMGVRINETRVHIPVHGGVGYTIFKFYDIRTNKYLGGGSL
jgi:RHS repeat-associated protein